MENNEYLLKLVRLATGDIALTIQDLSPKTKEISSVGTTASDMARPKKYTEDMVARFSEGTFERIADLLNEGEDRADFVRHAVEREIARRKRQRQREKAAEPSTG